MFTRCLPHGYGGAGCVHVCTRSEGPVSERLLSGEAGLLQGCQPVLVLTSFFFPVYLPGDQLPLSPIVECGFVRAADTAATVGRDGGRSRAPGDAVQGERYH